jgi:mono/diheme cytochrome c family protein
MILATALLLSVAPLHRSPADTGEVLFRAWCSSCHGADGKGVSKSMTRLAVPAADLASCANTAETEEQWVGVVRNGGAAYGLSMDMPSFGDNATREQIEAVVRFARSLCHESGWPPGELNFPRAFLAEKAFPENELVLVAQDREQQLIYERRVGKRAQIEAIARTNLDGGPIFESATAALKYNVFYRVKGGLIGTLGLELTPPLGRQNELELEPYFAFGLSPGTGLAIQGEALATFEDGFEGGTLNLGIAREISSRLVPMIEGAWTIPRLGGQSFGLYPQLWVRLSRLGHVAASIGSAIPLTGQENAKLIAFILWDFGDAPLYRGW